MNKKDKEKELIITKVNELYKELGKRKFYLFSEIFMSAIEECKLNKQEMKLNDLDRLLEESREKFYSKID